MMRCPDCGMILSAGGHTHRCVVRPATFNALDAVAELIAAARWVIDAHTNLRASDACVRKIDLANAVDRLRRALP